MAPTRKVFPIKPAVFSLIKVYVNPFAQHPLPPFIPHMTSLTTILQNLQQIQMCVDVITGDGTGLD